MTQNLMDSAKAVLRGKFIVIIPQETRKALNRQHNFIPKTTGKKEQQKKISRKKEIIKMQKQK